MSEDEKKEIEEIIEKIEKNFEDMELCNEKLKEAEEIMEIVEGGK